MKFSQVIKNRTINYRVCDELTCRSIAMHVAEKGKDYTSEYHLCDSHYLQYKAELKNAKISSRD